MNEWMSECVNEWMNCTADRHNQYMYFQLIFIYTQHSIFMCISYVSEQLIDNAANNDRPTNRPTEQTQQT